MAPARSGHKSIAWGDLSESKQLDVLVALQKRRGAALRRASDNVLAVGLGHRTKAGEVREELCLGVLVQKKSGRAKEQVPATVTTTIEHEGRRRRVEVPTDVEELGSGGPQHALAATSATNAANGIIVTSPSAPAIAAKGSVCAVVQLQGQPDVFVLSCHHVLTLSEKLGKCRVLADAVVADTRRVPYAQLFEYVPITPGKKSQLDAAISLVQPGHSVTWAHSGARPVRVDFGTSKPVNCTIYAPGRLLGATYVKTWSEVRLQYHGCVVQIAAAYQFAAATMDGDSGSPVISPDGTLHGMHFWGNPANGLALSIPAGLLFQAGAFQSGTLQLA